MPKSKALDGLMDKEEERARSLTYSSLVKIFFFWGGGWAGPIEIWAPNGTASRQLRARGHYQYSTMFF